MDKYLLPPSIVITFPTAKLACPLPRYLVWMTDKEITASLVSMVPSIAYWDQGVEMFVWREGRDEEIREFSPCEEPLAIREVELHLEGFVAEVLYPRQLVRVVKSAGQLGKADESDLSDAYWALVATPRQKAEAILRATGKWVGSLADEASPTAEFIVSINDGYVEYSYPWNLPQDYSISEICYKLEKALGCPPSAPGSIRETPHPAEK